MNNVCYNDNQQLQYQNIIKYLLSPFHQTFLWNPSLLKYNALFLIFSGLLLGISVNEFIITK